MKKRYFYTMLATQAILSFGAQNLYASEVETNFLFGEINLAEAQKLEIMPQKIENSDFPKNYYMGGPPIQSKSTPLKTIVTLQSSVTSSDYESIDPKMLMKAAGYCQERLKELKEEYSKFFSSNRPNFIYLSEMTQVKNYMNQHLEYFFKKILKMDEKSADTIFDHLSALDCFNGAMYLCSKKLFRNAAN